jgi:hypothetical protein
VRSMVVIKTWAMLGPQLGVAGSWRAWWGAAGQESGRDKGPGHVGGEDIQP